MLNKSEIFKKAHQATKYSFSKNNYSHFSYRKVFSMRLKDVYAAAKKKARIENTNAAYKKEQEAKSTILVNDHQSIIDQLSKMDLWQLNAACRKLDEETLAALAKTFPAKGSQKRYASSIKSVIDVVEVELEERG